MIKASDIKQLPVISIIQGRKISYVKDILYDPYENRVAALTVFWGDFIPKERYIYYQDVKNIGHDAVIIESPLVIKKTHDTDKSIIGLKKKDELLVGTKVVTEKGDKLGSVTDYFFDPETGIVTHLEVSQGTLSDLKSGRKVIPIDSIISIGKDATIVKVTTQEEVERQKNYGGIQGQINQLGHQFTQLARESKEKLEDQTQKIKQNLQETDKAQDIYPKEPKKEHYSWEEDSVYTSPGEEFNAPQNQYIKTSGNETSSSSQNNQTVFPSTPQDETTLVDKIPGYSHPNPHTPKSEREIITKDTNKFQEAVSTLEDLANKTKHQVSMLQDKAEMQINKLKQNQQIQDKYQQFNEDLTTTREKWHQKGQHYQTIAYNQVSAIKKNRIDYKKKNAVGLFLTKTILTPDDTVLAERGAIITNSLLAQAEKYGLLDQVLKNTSYNPIS